MPLIDKFTLLKIRVVAYCPIVLLILGIAMNARAQHGENLVLNGGFELRSIDLNGDTVCPGGGGQIGWTQVWGTALGSVDYFNACSNEMYPDFGVPNNRGGYQDDSNFGQAYAAFGSYSLQMSNAREFIWQELPSALKRGQGYRVSFKVSLMDSMNFAVDNIAVLFSEGSTQGWSKSQLFASKPQVESEKDQLLDKKVEWITVSGQFVADGGEKHLTIGTFKPDEELYYQRIDSIPTIINHWDLCGYYIDDVELYEDNSIGIRESEEYALELYPNPASELLVHIKVNGANSELERVTIKDQLGKVVNAVMARGKEQAIESVTIPAGVYSVEVLLKDGSVKRKRLVKH